MLLRHITAPSPAYAVHYYSAVYKAGITQDDWTKELSVGVGGAIVG